MFVGISNFWNLIFVTPLLNLLILFYNLLGQNMGLAILFLSLAVKVISLPLTHSSLKSMEKQKALVPKLNELKKKYGHDKKVLAEKQLQLYKDAGISPASGCLTQIFPILIIFALYGVINMVFGSHNLSLDTLNSRLYWDFLKLPTGVPINPNFLYLDLSKPDRFFVLPVLAAVFQFLYSKMMMPALSKAEKLAKKTEDKKDDTMYNMQEQMLYTMPIMFLIIGIRLPSGVVLNILVTTLFSLVQQYFVSGLGGLAPLFRKREV